MWIALLTSLLELAYILILLSIEATLSKVLRHPTSVTLISQHRSKSHNMPYATPSPSTSPSTTTRTILPSPPRSTPSTPKASVSIVSTPAGLPRRNHVRSFSSDAATSANTFHSAGHAFLHPESSHTNNNTTAVTLLNESSCKGPSNLPTRCRRVKKSNPNDSSEALSANDFGSFNRTPLILTSEPVTAPQFAEEMEVGPSLCKRPLHQKARNEMSMLLEINDIDLGSETPYKTPMLRKKSGELVRSSMKQSDHSRSASTPAARAKSCPSTPGGTKNVHFDSHLEHVKHFLAQQKPTAVSRDGSPVDTETEGEDEFPFPLMNTTDLGKVTLLMPNFPFNPDIEGKSKDVYLRSLDMTADGKSMRGVVQVKNLAFTKSIAIRFTFDAWQTVSEVSAEFVESNTVRNFDRFAFCIKLQDLLARIEEKVLYLAVRYTVDGREIWDNNGGINYEIGFRRVRTGSKAHATPSAALAAGSKAPLDAKAAYRWSVTTSGQANERMTELRAKLDRLVGDDLGVAPPITFRQTPSHTPGMGSNHALSSRYDFGSSLKQAAKGSPRGSPLESPQALKRAFAFPSTYIGGMPATASSEVSPMNGRGRELPSFVGPCIPSPPCPSSPSESQMPLVDNPSTACPQAAKLAGHSQQNSQQIHSANETHKPGSRLPSYTPSQTSLPSTYSNASVSTASNAMSYLTPPTSGSPSTSRGGTPTDSPITRSPTSHSSPRCCSPISVSSVPLESVRRGIPSPSPSESGPSSPESPPQGGTRVRSPESFLFEGSKAGMRPDLGSQSYGDFLQSFCWGGALGLTSGVGEHLATLPYDPRTAGQTFSSVTPRATSPLPIPAELLEAAHFSRTNSPLIQSVRQQAIS